MYQNKKIFILIIFVLIYDISPIDLIPDFIPVIGTLDDAAVSAVAIWLARRCTPTA